MNMYPNPQRAIMLVTSVYPDFLQIAGSTHQQIDAIDIMLIVSSFPIQEVSYSCHPKSQSNGNRGFGAMSSHNPCSTGARVTSPSSKPQPACSIELDSRLSSSSPVTRPPADGIAKSFDIVLPRAAVSSPTPSPRAVKSLRFSILLSELSCVRDLAFATGLAGGRASSAYFSLNFNLKRSLTCPLDRLSKCSSGSLMIRAQSKPYFRKPFTSSSSSSSVQWRFRARFLGRLSFCGGSLGTIGTSNACKHHSLIANWRFTSFFYLLRLRPNPFMRFVWWKADAKTFMTRSDHESKPSASALLTGL